MIFWAKYGVQTTFSFPMVKRGVVDLAVSADWTPAAADSAISKDQAGFADTTNTVAAVGGSPTRAATGWKITLTATELQAAQVDIQIVDAATKAVEDQFLTIYTYGNASAKFVPDFSVANLAANVTQLLGTAWLTPGTAGTPDVNTKLLGGTAQTGRDIGASVLLAAGAIAAATFSANAIDSSAIATSGANEVRDAVWAQAMAELSAVPAPTDSVLAAMEWFLAIMRNKRTQTATTETLFKDDGSTTLGTSTKSDDGTTFTRGEYA